MLVVLKLLHKIDAICRPSLDVVGFLKNANLRRRRYIKLIHAVYNFKESRMFLQSIRYMNSASKDIVSPTDLPHKAGFTYLFMLES